MQKKVLAYNFSEDRIAALKLACMLVRVQLAVVPRADLLQPIGALAGLPDFERVSDVYEGEEATKEMLIFCGLNRPELDRYLSAIKKGKLKQVALKAMMTPTNAEWTGLALQEELAKEHEYMHGNKGNANLGKRHLSQEKEA